MTVHPEQLALSIVLERLHQAGLDAARNAASMRGKLSVVAGRYPALTRRELDNLRWSSWHSSFGANRVIYLQAPNANSIAALWYKWHFKPADPVTHIEPIPMCKFYYGVWKMGDPHPKPTTTPVTRVASFSGYRFEPPEIRGTDHGYYHSQPCRSMGDKATADPFALDVDDKGPTMPLAAKNSIDLLLCVFMSLYGARKFKTFANELKSETRVRRNVELRESLDRIAALAMR